ncbi:hypothetical protein BD408DRAFT_448861 [Parasitella parasitica]|nr:hypothetical protein BD408DRAFT_448861 [Parasitella parasitica]
MDIQYNNGPQAVRYLAKYLAKDDHEARINYSAVEAVYDVMGWHKHKNSRNALFLNTGLINFDSRKIRDDIDELPENSENMFSATHVEVATGSKEFIKRCKYVKEHGNQFLRVPFYEGGTLPKYVASGNLEFILRNTKESFWRTYNQSEKMSGDSFYYQQIVTKRAIFATTFMDDKGRYMTWKDYYEHLIRIPVDQGGIEPHGVRNITSVDDISDLDRGHDITRQEIQLMLRSANEDQTSVYKQVKREMGHNSVAFVSGAAEIVKNSPQRLKLNRKKQSSALKNES